MTLLIIGVSAAIAVYFAKGYSFNPKEGRLVGTGIITVTSVPDAASVYIDGHLTTATDATISNLSPKEYTVKVIKEGFIPWEKKVEVKEGLVTDLKVTLFPAIPTIYPLTFNGAKNPVLSPDGSKLAFVVPVSTASASLNDSPSVKRKAGVWVWTFKSDQPIAFARGAEPHQIAETRFTDYSNATLRWSPDSGEVLASIEDKNHYLLDSDNFNNDPRDITPTLQTTLNSWQEENGQKEALRIQTITDLNKRKTASESAVLKWSPDETKVIFGGEKGKAQNLKEAIDESKASLKVYDIETNQEHELPTAKLHFWLPDSLHVVLVEDNQISIVDFDGTNKAVIYAGGFDDSLVFAWPDSSRLVFINSYQTPTASQPNLYGINLK